MGITRIVPKGMDVPANRQITVEFNRKVVPLGQMEREESQIPITIRPKVKGQWRWLTPSTLSLEFDEKERLKPATSYTMTILPGLVAEDGSTMAQPHVHSFTTVRPKARYTSFKTWNSPGTPVVRVVFNQPVTKQSVQEHLFFQVAQNGNQPARVIVNHDPDDLEPLNYSPGNAHIPEKDQAKSGNSGKDKKDEARRIWLVLPENELPHNARVVVKITAGLRSALGSVPGQGNHSLVEFDTFPEFKFLGLESYLNNNKAILIRPDASGGKEQMPKPNPLAHMALVFSSPVSVDDFRKSVEFFPALAGDNSGFDPWANLYSYSSLGFTHTKGQTYQVSFPVNLAAFTDYRIKESLLRFKDQFGRRLETPLDFSFFTDHRPPDYNLIYNSAVLEDGVKTDLPLVVTNLDRVMVNYKYMTVHGTKADLEHSVAVPGVEDIAVKVPLGINTMLENQSGAVYGNLTSRPGVKKSKWQKNFFAQVTPFEVHVKSGHFNTLVWVVDLKTGDPVADATVCIYKDAVNKLNSTGPVLSQGVTGKDGTIVLAGNSTLDPELKLFNWSWEDSDERFFVKVVKNDSMALLPLSPKFETDTFRASGAVFSSSLNQRYSHVHTWGTTAQGIYRAGETIDYKIYVRDQNNGSFTHAPDGVYTLKIVNPTGKVVHEQGGIKLSRFGAFDGKFKTSKTGGVGYHYFELSADFTNLSWTPLKVLVSDFVPSPFRVTTELNTPCLRPGQRVEVTTRARLHAGGPYTEASTRIVARLDPEIFSSSNPLVKDFWFQADEYEQEGVILVNAEKTLDNRGDLITSFDLTHDLIPFGCIVVESSVRDDRGGSIAASTSADFFGRNRFVGLKSDYWLYAQGRDADFPFVVVDEKANPVPEVKTWFCFEQLKTKASRVKGAGNAFQTIYVDEWVKVKEFQAVSGKEPLKAGFVPESPGDYRITAKIEDTKGRSHSSSLRFWVTGRQRVVWHEPEADVLTLISENNRLEVGKTARYMVKNPFPGAIALMTVERYGVLKHWITTLEGSTPVIEFPIEPEFAPGFFFSVNIISPRVAVSPGNQGVDLGKPVSRMGYQQVEVVDPERQIKVDVHTDKDTYKPGETVRLKVRLDNNIAPNLGADTSQSINPEAEPVELAIAILDEAVFDLIDQGRNHFDPFKGFYTIDGLDLVNYSLLKKLIGIQNFAKKGASPGGDGGAAISMRSLFKYVCYWNPSIVLDSSVKAEVEFKVPDNLTGWRVFAMAMTPTDRMGMGEHTFKVNRPTEVRPVMPNQVMVGDSFTAGFSIMNRTDQERVLTVNMDAIAGIEQIKDKITSVSKSMSLPPFKRETLWLPVTAKKQGKIKFKVTAKDNVDGDGMEHVLFVNPRKNFTTVAAYGNIANAIGTQTIKVPEKIRTDQGDLGVVLSSSVLGTVEPALVYMRDYPYTCWEQQLSRTVVAALLPDLKPWLSRDAAKDTFWNKSHEFIIHTLEQAENFQAPNGGMAYFIPEQDRVSPYLSAYTAFAFNLLRKTGYTIPGEVEKKLYAYLYKLLKQDIVPQFYSRGMTATVRAIALAGIAGSNGKVIKGKIKYGLADGSTNGSTDDSTDNFVNDPAGYSAKKLVDNLERLFPHLNAMSLFGRAMFLEAALSTPGAEAMADKAVASILALSNRTGAKISFSEILDSGYKRLAATPIRANSAILSALIGYSKTSDAVLSQEILPGLVRYLTQTRAGRDHWENTQDTVFALRAFSDYARTYEQEKTAMGVVASINGKELGSVDFQGKNQDSVCFTRPIQPDDQGKSLLLKVEKKGQGRLYYKTLMNYALETPSNQPVNAGIAVERRVWVEQNGKYMPVSDPVTLKPGDLVRVDLFVSPGGARNFVVVEDPVPGGLEPVNRDLATSLTVDQGIEEPPLFKTPAAIQALDAGQRYFYHREMTHQGVRFYSEWLAPGDYRLSYTAQVICKGRFAWPPAHALEMYDRDVFGQGVETTLVVTDGADL